MQTSNNKDPIFSYQPLWGSWRVDSLIGEGSYGKVYKVTRKELGYTYTSAVKIITIPSKEQLREAVSSFGDDEDTLKNYFEGMVENILSEINLLYRLRGSPNIVVYEDHMVVEKKDSLGWDILIRMEYVTSLPAYLSKNRLNRENVIGLGLDICTAISLCSKNNIIHRDIKDENIFVSKDTVFKLGDFGIAKELSKSGKAASFKGTPLFMSPEVFRGEKYDVRSDIYSLGIVMYKLLNKGRVPFMPLYPDKVGYKDSENAIVKRFAGETIALPTHSGKDLGSIVLKACSYRKEDRYKDPIEMKKALQEVLTTMDSKLLNEDVSFLTSAKEEKKVDKTVSIFDMPVVEKPQIVEEVKEEVIPIIPPVVEEKTSTKKEAKISDKKNIVHKEPVVVDKPKTKTNITKKLLTIGIPSVVFILAVIALIVFMFFKTSLPVKDISSSETSETQTSFIEESTVVSIASSQEETILNREEENSNESISDRNFLNGKLAYFKKDSKSIYILDLKKNNESIIDLDMYWQGPLTSLAWSPDGSILTIGFGMDLYNINVFDNSVKKIYSLRTTRVDDEDTVESRGYIEKVKWSPDSKFLLITVSPGSGDTAYYEVISNKMILMDKNGNNLRVILEDLDLRFLGIDWSKVNSKIVYSSGKGMYSYILDEYGNVKEDFDMYGYIKLWILDVDNNFKSNQIAEFPGWTNEECHHGKYIWNCEWFSNGEKILFDLINFELPVGNILEDSMIYVIDSDGENAREFLRGCYPNLSYDNNAIIYLGTESNDSGEYPIILENLNTKEQRIISWGFRPAWYSKTEN